MLMLRLLVDRTVVRHDEVASQIVRESCNLLTLGIEDLYHSRIFVHADGIA
jgi:hypothetical protein